MKPSQLQIVSVLFRNANSVKSLKRHGISRLYCANNNNPAITLAIAEYGGGETFEKETFESGDSDRRSACC